LAALATAETVARFIRDAHWLNRAVNRFVVAAHPFPVHGWNGFIVLIPPFHLLLTTGPVIALGLFQSYRMFRREQAENVRSVIRHLVSLWTVVLISIFSTNMVVSYGQAIFSQQRDVLAEIARAVDNLPLDAAKLDSAHPQQVTFQDLNRVYPLSETARTWLSNANIGIYPRPANPYVLGENGHPQQPTAKFAAVLQFSNGSECRVYASAQYCRDRGEPFPEFLRGRL
jgi:hypothetical protein